MTKDELNEVLKEDDLELDKQFNGIGKAEFIVRTIYSPNKQAINFNGVDFYVQDRSCFSPWTLKALADYAYTPIEERKPKPQLYNIIIAEDVATIQVFFTAWKKEDRLGAYSTSSCLKHALSHDDDFKFTVEEIEDLKSKVSEKQKQIIDIGMVKVEEVVKEVCDKTIEQLNTQIDETQ